MEPTFEFASGTVQGRDHRLQGKNNQDAFRLLTRGDVTVAVVCDGCGSGARSEIGAVLGAEHAAALITASGPAFDPAAVSQALATTLRTLVPTSCAPHERDPDFRTFVMESLLFTLVGAIITPDKTTFFALGDGIVIINGEATVLGPYADNAPPYLGYRLLLPKNRHLDIQVIRELPTAELDSFLVGTDGVEHLIAAETKTVPGRTDPVGPLSRLWQEDRFFRNRDMVRRFLTVANQEATVIDWESRTASKEHGRLPDDTTLITGRRRREQDHA